MSGPRIPPMDEDAQALARSGSLVFPAPRGARARVLARVEARLLSAGDDGSEGPGAESSDAAIRLATRRPSRGWLSRALPLALSFALGALTVAVGSRLLAWSPAPPGATLSASPTQTAGPSSVAPPTAGDPPAAPIPGGLPLPSQPEPARREAPVASRRGPAQAPAVEEYSGDALARERLLLDRARAALEREEPALALAATREHERAFPQGILVQEREATAIRALLGLGRTEEARARLGRFRHRFPGSALLAPIVSAVNAAAGP